MDNSEMYHTVIKEYLRVQRRKSAMVSIFKLNLRWSWAEDFFSLFFNFCRVVCSNKKTSRVEYFLQFCPLNNMAY